MVQGLCKRVYFWDPCTCGLAARRGNLKLLQWCKSNGCPRSWHRVVLQCRFGYHFLRLVHRLGGAKVSVKGHHVEWWESMALMECGAQVVSEGMQGCIRTYSGRGIGYF